MRESFQLPLSKERLQPGQDPIRASRIGNLLFTSGISGIDVKTGTLPEGPERQFGKAFDNLVALLGMAGAGPESIGLLTVWIPGRSHRAFINKDWLQLYPAADRPARKTNQAKLPEGVEVQLMASCVTGEKRLPLEIPGLSHKDPLPMGTRLGNFVFSSVVAPEDPRTGKLVEGPLPQIDCAFENMKRLMKSAGGSDSDINHVWVFMKDFAWQQDMVKRWVRDYPNFGDRPARKTLPYELAGETQIQVQLTGVLGGKRRNYEIPGVGHDDPIPMASSIGRLLQSSGIFGIDPATGKRVEGLQAQLEKALRNIRALLDQSEAAAENIVHLTVMLQDYSDVPQVSAALRDFFPDDERAPAIKFITYRMPAHWRVQFHVTAVI
jgi:2-iminobutanoate/2-iminopropanoate deaminase